MPSLYTMQLTLNNDDFALAQALVAQYMQYGWQEDSLPTGEKTILVHCEDLHIIDMLMEEIQAYLPAVRSKRGTIEQKDWHLAWKDFFTPVHADKFLVVPPWQEFEETDLIPIRIEPKSAFGTGHHMSTELCLRIISKLYNQGKIKPNQKFLDLGTGTGILGIACCKLGLTGLGLDIDPNSISNAYENIELNALNAPNGTQDFEVREGSIQDTNQKYSLVIANILANPLKEMAEDIISRMESGGMLILSGFLKVQCPALEATYAALGKPQIYQEVALSPNNIDDSLQNYPSSPWCCMYWA